MIKKSRRPSPKPKIVFFLLLLLLLLLLSSFFAIGIKEEFLQQRIFRNATTRIKEDK